MSSNPNQMYEEIDVDVEGSADGSVEEVEVEVTDDETSETEEKASRVTPSKKPGKVSPSEAVMSMELKSPENAAKSSGAGLNPNKNPFPTFGAWDEKTMSEISIVFPALTPKDESTNDLTKSSRPENRYWKAPIVFKYHNFQSDTLRFDNVHIPFHTNRDYGSSFVYMSIPGFAAKRFSEAGKTRRPTIVNEKSLRPDENRWWKIANKVDDKFGVIKNGKFQPKSLPTVFGGSQAGITATVVLRFVCKASTEELLPLKPTTPCTVAVEVERGYITELDVNVQMPVRIKNEKAKVEPVATKKDIATDALLSRLSALGL